MLYRFPRYGESKHVETPASKTSEMDVRSTVIDVERSAYETFFTVFGIVPEVFEDK